MIIAKLKHLLCERMTSNLLNNIAAHSANTQVA